MADSYETHEYVLIALFFIFLGINVVDIGSTVLGLSRGFIELNWLAVILMKKLGMIPALILLKLIFSGIIGVTIWFVLRETPNGFLDDDVLIVGLLAVNILGFLVLSNNLSYLGLWPNGLPVYHFKSYF